MLAISEGFFPTRAFLPHFSPKLISFLTFAYCREGGLLSGNVTAATQRKQFGLMDGLKLSLAPGRVRIALCLHAAVTYSCCCSLSVCLSSSLQPHAHTHTCLRHVYHNAEKGGRGRGCVYPAARSHFCQGHSNLCLLQFSPQFHSCLVLSKTPCAAHFTFFNEPSSYSSSAHLHDRTQPFDRFFFILQ